MRIRESLLTVALLLSLATVSFAEDIKGHNDGAQEDKQAQQERQFAERKERAEKRISDNIAKEQERLSCIERANPDNFKSCFPPPSPRHDDCHR